MTSVMRISLKSGDKIYINGAVLQVDHKVSLQLLNDATFLLGSHVLQAEDATSPLRQLYFVTQALLMDPDSESDILPMFDDFCKALTGTFVNKKILDALKNIEALVAGGQAYAALKQIRALYPLENEITRKKQSSPIEATLNIEGIDNARRTA